MSGIQVVTSTAPTAGTAGGFSTLGIISGPCNADVPRRFRFLLMWFTLCNVVDSRFGVPYRVLAIAP